MKSLSLTLMLLMTACGTEGGSKTETISGTNSAGTNTVTTTKNLPVTGPYPKLEGYTTLTESLETCIMSGYCEARFVAPADCADATVVMVIVDTGTARVLTENVALVGNEEIVIRFEGSGKVSFGDWSNQTFTQFKCEN